MFTSISSPLEHGLDKREADGSIPSSTTRINSGSKNSSH